MSDKLASQTQTVRFDAEVMLLSITLIESGSKKWQVEPSGVEPGHGVEALYKVFTPNLNDSSA